MTSQPNILCRREGFLEKRAPASCAPGGVEPAQRQFIDHHFRDVLGGAGTDPSDAARENTIITIHRRLFIEGASVSTVRAEFLRYRRSTNVIAVTSGKGGVGKTTVSVNLAIAFAQRGLRTLIFDADLGMANVHVFVGVNPAATLADVLGGSATLRSAITPGPAGVDAICGASGVGWLADLRPSQIDALGRGLLTVAADYDILLLDTGAGISTSVMQFLTLASDIVVVATPNLAAVLDAYGVIKLAHQNRIAARMHLVINQADTEADAARAAGRISSCAGRFLSAAPRKLGWLPRDRAVEQANQNRRPLQAADPAHPHARLMARFAGELLTEMQRGGQPIAEASNTAAA